MTKFRLTAEGLAGASYNAAHNPWDEVTILLPAGYFGAGISWPKTIEVELTVKATAGITAFEQAIRERAK